jgi:hypothetical protein
MNTPFSLFLKFFAHNLFVLALAFAFLSCLNLGRAQSFIPDLSQLSESQKKDGIGQFQEKSQEEKDQEKEEQRKRERRERERRENQRLRLHSLNHHASPVIVVGAAGAAGAGAALGSSALRDSNVSAPIQSEPLIVYEDESEPPYDVSFDSPETSPIAKPLRFRERFQFCIDGNALAFYDLSGSSTPITQNIQASRVRIKEATGFEAAIGIRPIRSGESGFGVRGMFIEGSSSADTASATLLFTTPNIGFAGNPVQVERDSSLLGIEANWLFGELVMQSHFGFRVHQYEDGLLTRVMQNGVLHQINTKSTSLMAQFGINPRSELGHIHLESMFQVGAGIVAGESETHLRGVVGPISDFTIESDRIKLALLFHGRMGIAIPITKYGRLRTGLQILAHNNMAHASGQIPITNFANSQARLRTNTLAIGGGYAGFELNW